jgi:ABC-type transport system substrate-binding protein
MMSPSIALKGHMMMKTQTILVTTLLAFTLAACGDTQTERAATGALGGAVAGEIISGDPLAGAAIGGLGGALIRR